MTRASDLAKLLGAGATINDGTTITTADNDPQLILKCTDTDASTGPKLDLERNPGEAGADGDNLAQINFYGYNDASEKTQYLYLFAEAADVANGSEDVRFGFGGLVAGADSSLMTFMHGTSATGADPEMVFNDSSKDINFRVESNGNANMLFVDGGNDRVGIGTGSPSNPLDVQTSAGKFSVEALGGGSVRLASNGSMGLNVPSGYNYEIDVNGSEVMRVDSSGNLLVGKTSAGIATVGLELKANNAAIFTRSGSTVLYLNRTSDAGDLIEFRKDNTAVGHISTDFDTIAITGASSTASHTSGLAFVSSSSAQRIVPCQQGTSIADNTMDLGGSGQRFDDIHASNGTIQTSDRNDKQDIEELTDAEKRVAVVAKGLMRKYRWKSAVTKKGDKARTHFGIIAQDLQDAFTAEGLDASKYAMFCSDTWWEKEITVDAVESDEEKGIEAQDAYTRRDVKEEATEGYTEITRLGVRYSELLAFIISAI